MRTSRILIDCAIASAVGAALGAYVAIHSVAPSWLMPQITRLCALSLAALVLFGRSHPRCARLWMGLVCASALCVSAHHALAPAPPAFDASLLTQQVHAQGEVVRGCRPVATPCSFEARLHVHALATRESLDIEASAQSATPPPSKAEAKDMATVHTRIYLPDGEWSPLPGDVFSAKGKLRKPAAGLHPYAFNPEVWSERQGIDAGFHFDEPPTLDAVNTPWTRRIDHWRARLEHSMLRSDRADASGILIAMSTGTKSGLSEEVRARFAAAGTAHVLAVSGLHLGLLAGVLWWSFTRFFRLFPRLLRRWNADALSASITLPTLAMYVVFTGMPASAMRAGWMAAALLVPRIFHRRGSNLHGLCLAISLLLAHNPRLIVDLGFQLSVSATLSLILLARGIQRRRHQKQEEKEAQEAQAELDAHDQENDHSFVFGQLGVASQESMRHEDMYSVQSDKYVASVAHESASFAHTRDEHPSVEAHSQEETTAGLSPTAHTAGDSRSTSRFLARLRRFHKHLKPALFWTASAFEVSIVSTLATAPFLVWNFGGVPIFSPLPNVIVVPPLSIVALPMGVMGAMLSQVWPWAGTHLIEGSLWVIDACLAIARSGAWIFERELLLGRPAWIGVIGWALIAGASPWMFRRRRWKIWGVMALGALAVAGDAELRAPSPNNLEIHAIPVGQGDATWVRFPGGRSMLIDAGGVGYGPSKTGTNYVLPYLRAHGVGQVDILVATHGHADHVNGITELVPLLSPTQIWVGDHDLERPVDRALYDVAREHGVPYVQPHRLWREVQIGETRIEILPMGHTDSINDGSVVLRICYADFCALMTGDAEQDRERFLVQLHRSLRAQYLKVGHHGSNTSTTEAFLARVRPNVAVIELGKDNQFRFPHDGVLDRLQRHGVRTWRTDRGEAIVHVSDGHSLWLQRSHLWPDLLRRFRGRKRDDRAHAPRVIGMN